MNSQLSFDAMSLSPAHADHVTTGHGGHGPNHQHPHAAPTSSAAEPIALILLSVGALSLLQAFLRSFLSNRISLPSAEYQPLPTSEHAVSSIEEHERSVDPYLTSTVAAQPLLASDYEQEEEEKLAEAALGKAVELDDFRVRSRNKLAALALFATVNLAISAGQLAWIVAASHRKDSQGRLVEFLLRTGVNTLTILVIFRRNSISAWNLAVSLTAACFLNFATQLLTLLVPPGFAIFPEVASKLAGGEVRSAGMFMASAQHGLHVAATRAVIPANLFLETVSQTAPPALLQFAHDISQSNLAYIFLNVLTLLSALFAFYFASTIPLAPARVYQPLPTSKPGRMLAQGALGGDSLLVRLTHAFMLPIIFFAKRNGGLDADDVPYLHPEIRSIILFLGFRKIWRTKREEKGGKTSPLMLLGCLVYANRRAILWSLPFGWLVGAQFYAPSFAINRFIAVFERQEATGGERDVRSGIVWATTVFAISASQNILMGMLLTNFWSTMRSSVRQQITTLLFSKALKRQDISGSAPAESADKKKKGDGEGDQPANGVQAKDDKTKNKKKKKKGKGDEEEEKAFGSKAAVMTLISNDCERVIKIAEYTLLLGILLFEVIVGFSYVYILLGWGAFVGLATILFFAPLVYLIGKLNSRFQENLMKARDKRVTFLNEAIEAIRMIKFSAWERKIMDRILLSRRRELQELKKVFYCEILNEFVVDFSPSAIIIVAFMWAMLVEGRKITPSVAFTSVAVLNELRFALTELPSLVQALIELWVSLRRISAFLDLPEVEPPKTASPQPAFEGAPKVELRGASISWPVHVQPKPKENQIAASTDIQDGPTSATSSLSFKLQDVSVEFEAGKVNLICGKVGSGKSMLLLGLLGELTVESGTIDSPRSHPNALGGIMTAAFVSPNEWLRSDLTAYVPQTAWLTNASLRDNILWGLPMDEKRYQDTLFACGLVPDLEILEDGDLTDIGEQGIGLSGGQKTRVSLARAVYSRASLVFMDSPLSNVDAHTAKHIQEHLLDGPLLAKRTVLLVTHQIAISAPNAAKVVMLDDGKICFDGPTEDFLHSDFYSGLLEDEKEEEELATPALPSAAESTMSPTASGAATPESSVGSAATTPATSRAPSLHEDEDDSKPAKQVVLKEARKMISEEARKRGAVGWSTYKAWIDAAGGLTMFLLMILAFAVFCGWALLSSFWLRGLSADASRKQPSHSPLYWVVGYAGLLSAQSVLKAIAFLSLYLLSLRASANLFATMLDSVFRAKLRTHDTIPKGRFLNRFSSDMESNDQLLPAFFSMFCTAAGSFLVGLIAVFIAGGHQFVWMLVILAPVYIYTASLYRIVTRDLRRLEAASKSPVTTSFSDLLSGSVVVRAFGSSGRMMSNLLTKSDDSARFMWLLSEATRFTIFVIQFCSAFLVLAGNISILMNPRIDSATAGFATSFLVTTDFLLMFSLMTFSNLEQKAVSTERIVEYQGLPQEPPALMGSGPHSGWPHKGAIEIRDLEIKYAPDLPYILKGISLTIPPGAKVGILGRTGSGKSTLASSFFRFVEPSRGQILIDDVDLTSLGLEQLRSKLTIVPQDPVILSGTLREALDPFQEHSDEEVTAALKSAYLIPSDEAQAAKSNFSDLSYAIAEGGSNLSGGQRQLLCLGRALLQRSRVVFFDEASSALDSETDAAIATTIRDAFRESTVLTIAHRLRTVADFDYVLVLHDGQVAEFDKPIRLIDNTSSRYHKLCKAAGRAEFRHLREMGLKSAA